MNALWITLACFSGVFAFAFLLAGIQGMQDEEPELPKDPSGKIAHVFDATVFGALGSMLRGLSKNWDKRADERRLIYAGMISLAAFLIFVCLAK